MNPDRKLVFDIGLNNGEDTAYYLWLGYKVLAVEADPELTKACSFRFGEEIRQGNVKIVNAGVLKSPGEFKFFRNLMDHGWSTFDPGKGQKPGEWQEVVVPCTTTQQLIAEYGKPYFMKVDIEGSDLLAIESLTAETAPPYVSVELSAVDPIMERLLELGYSDFKFVNGESFRPTTPIFDHEIGWRTARKAGHIFPPVRMVIGSLPERLRPKIEYDPPGRYSPDGYPFSRHSSGPFGEQAAGSWLPPKTALRRFENLKSLYERAGSAHSLWFDVHARHNSAR
ncbi:MAG TPA: FkbM family methyltransferase [Bryobacteraceae bacterium]|nr:FkbM family methyltransferase [Bryobacteraceae bacterium]